MGNGYAKYSSFGGGGGGSGGGVTSVNTLTGAVVLAAGTNITLGTVGNTITINSSAGGGSVTSVSVTTANGFSGTVATPTSTPAISINTSFTGIAYSTSGSGLAAAVAANFPTLNQNTTGTAANITATSNSTLTTLSALSLPGSQVTGNISGNAANITATSNSTLTTLSALSLPYSQITGAPAAITALTGDGTATGPGSVALTLATVNTNVGSFGSSTSIPSFTVNGKGLITAASGNAVIAPAGTLSGTTLNSSVVSSSLTSVGTIGTGTWQGTPVTVPYGGTGLSTLTSGSVLVGAGTSSPTLVAPGTSGNVLTSNGSTWISSTPTGGGFTDPMTSTGDMIYSSSNTPTPTRLPIGTSGQILTVASGIPSWSSNPLAGGAFFVSSAVTTTSSGITANTFTTFSNSPALSFTPTVTGTYRVYSAIPLNTSGSGILGVCRVFNTSGSATLLAASYGTGSSGSSGLLDTAYCESVYTLTAGTTYQFDIQASTNTGTVTNVGSSAAFYMFAQGVVTGTGALTVGSVLGSSTPNAATITAAVLQLGPTDGVNPGILTTGTQVIGGSKTFGYNLSDAIQIGAAGSTAVSRIAGGQSATVRTVTSSVSVDSTYTDYYIFCNQTAAITITLPNPGVAGRTLFIKDTTGSAQTNNITIAPFSAETIEGLSSNYVFGTNFGTLMLASDGNNWWVM